MADKPEFKPTFHPFEPCGLEKGTGSLNLSLLSCEMGLYQFLPCAVMVIREDGVYEVPANVIICGGKLARPTCDKQTLK